MEGVSESVDIICPLDIFSSSNDKRNTISEIISAICALSNSNGGKVVLHTVSHARVINRPTSYQRSSVIRKIEQTMISIIGTHQTVANINFKKDKKSMAEILVKKADSLITTNYNLYLPSQTQVVQVPATEPLERMRDILTRKDIRQAIVLNSHHKIFIKFETCAFEQTKKIQFKCLKSRASKRTTLADRITGKGNKLSCYVSAFANYTGGHIYYGINDDGIVEGEFIVSEEDTNEIAKKVEKVIKKMIWPEQTRQPKRGTHWEIFYEPVVNQNSQPIPSTFIIVIYIAPCLGGVFTEEPECYEMVEGKVEKMSYVTWKNRVLQNDGPSREGIRSRAELYNQTKFEELQAIWLCSNEEVRYSVGRIMWSSVQNRKACTFTDQVLMQLINNGNWNAISKKGKFLENQYAQLPQMKLLVLSKHVTARYRRGHFNEAKALLQEYTDILPQARDLLIFKVLQLYLNAALKRAIGDFAGLKEFLFAALSQAEFIEPGLVPAIVYIFGATVADLVKSEDQTETLSPQHLSVKALQHLERVPDPSNVLADMKQKSYITLATFYLGLNISGHRIRDHEKVRLNEAKRSIMAVHESIYEGNSLSAYREVQLNLVQSVYYYRYSQVAPDQRARYLSDAFNYAKKAESLARDYQFMEMVEWSKTHKALCTEELLRTRLCFGEIGHSSRKQTVNTMGPFANTDSEEREAKYPCQEGVRLIEANTVTPLSRIC